MKTVSIKFLVADDCPMNITKIMRDAACGDIACYIDRPAPIAPQAEPFGFFSESVHRETGDVVDAMFHRRTQGRTELIGEGLVSYDLRVTPLYREPKPATIAPQAVGSIINEDSYGSVAHFPKGLPPAGTILYSAPTANTPAVPDETEIEIELPTALLSDDHILLTMRQFVDIRGGHIGFCPEVKDLVGFARVIEQEARAPLIAHMPRSATPSPAQERVEPVGDTGLLRECLRFINECAATDWQREIVGKLFARLGVLVEDATNTLERDMRNYAVAAERKKWAERNDIHTESSRIYSRLASAVRAGADDYSLARLLRCEVNSRA